MSANPTIRLIAGPTASGKSALALRLAEETGGEVVNADALQIYRDLRILTARPSAWDEARARHHLYGVADAAETWSVGAWLRAALPIIESILARGRTPIVTGGTGLYFMALTKGLAHVPAVPNALREQVRADFDRRGEPAFRDALRDADPAAEARISLGDRQRLLRAMEVFEATGRPLTAWQADTAPALAPGTWSAIVLEPDRAPLYARCDARLQAMLDDGVLAEVEVLAERGLDAAAPAMKATGMREFAAHLRGEITLDQALALARQETRRYAKRQSTWLRNQTPDWPRIAALEIDDQWRDLMAIERSTS